MRQWTWKLKSGDRRERTTLLNSAQTMTLLARCDSLSFVHGWYGFLVSIMARRSRWIDGLTFSNYHRNWCQILLLWFPLTTIAFFDSFGQKSVAQFLGNPVGEILLYSVNITSM